MAHVKDFLGLVPSRRIGAQRDRNLPSQHLDDVVANLKIDSFGGKCLREALNHAAKRARGLVAHLRQKGVEQLRLPIRSGESQAAARGARQRMHDVFAAQDDRSLETDPKLGRKGGLGNVSSRRAAAGASHDQFRVHHDILRRGAELCETQHVEGGALANFVQRLTHGRQGGECEARLFCVVESSHRDGAGHRDAARVQGLKDTHGHFVVRRDDDVQVAEAQAGNLGEFLTASLPLGVRKSPTATRRGSKCSPCSSRVWTHASKRSSASTFAMGPRTNAKRWAA